MKAKCFHALRFDRMIVKGVKVLEEMPENGCFPNKMTFLIMFEGLHDLGKEENKI